MLSCPPISLGAVEQRDVVAAFRRVDGGGQARRARADHGDGFAVSVGGSITSSVS